MSSEDTTGRRAAATTPAKTPDEAPADAERVSEGSRIRCDEFDRSRGDTYAVGGKPGDGYCDAPPALGVPPVLPPKYRGDGGTNQGPAPSNAA